ncbi:restriction endonuclease S subunit [Methanolobus psychrophilus R15]|nr:restriction endonuclease S subunit [Methanolobus psychrophilus R15]
MEKERMPDNWNFKKLNDVAEIIMGQSPPGSSYNENGEGMPFLQGKAEFGKLFPSNIKYTTDPKKIALKDSILISVRAPVGDVNIANKEYCIGRGLASINFIGGDNKFLYYLLIHLKEELEHKSTGSTFKSISKDVLSNVIIPIPPLDIQREIVTKIDKNISQIELLKAEIEKQLNAINQLPKSILDEAFGKYDTTEKV